MWFLIYVEKTPMARTVIVLLPGISHWNQSEPNSTRLYLVLLTNGTVNLGMGTGFRIKWKKGTEFSTNDMTAHSDKYGGVQIILLLLPSRKEQAQTAQQKRG